MNPPRPIPGVQEAAATGSRFARQLIARINLDKYQRGAALAPRVR